MAGASKRGRRMPVASTVKNDKKKGKSRRTQDKPRSSRNRRTPPRRVGLAHHERGDRLNSSLTRRAYVRSDAYSETHEYTGHLDIEKKILLSYYKRYIGVRNLVLPCADGTLDRALVLSRAKILANGGEFRLLGIDLSPENIEVARSKMHEFIQERPVLRRSFNDGRLKFEYLVAKLGNPADEEGNLEVDGENIPIPNFLDIDLQNTVIGAKYPDTIITFMLWVLWNSGERRDGLVSLSEKCRPKTDDLLPTYCIKAEEYPTGITRGANWDKDFIEEVKRRKKNEVDPKILWAAGGIFPTYGGLHMINGSSRKGVGLPYDEHPWHYGVSKFVPELIIDEAKQYLADLKAKLKELKKQFKASQ
jgi:hypothetical protein